MTDAAQSVIINCPMTADVYGKVIICPNNKSVPYVSKLEIDLLEEGAESYPVGELKQRSSP